MGKNQQAITSLKELGSADLSYSLQGGSRFRVNIFSQRGSYAIVMRVIPHKVPTFEDVEPSAPAGGNHEPEQRHRPGHGAHGLRQELDPGRHHRPDQYEKAWHIVTIEDPIEFLHHHKGCTIHQRELHSDTPSFAWPCAPPCARRPR